MYVSRSAGDFFNLLLVSEDLVAFGAVDDSVCVCVCVCEKGCCECQVLNNGYGDNELCVKHPWLLTIGIRLGFCHSTQG